MDSTGPWILLDHEFYWTMDSVGPSHVCGLCGLHANMSREEVHPGVTQALSE
jgi:hypothetical protein